MKSTFHELELDQAVVQNVTPVGTEQLIVRLKPGSDAAFQFEIKQNTKNSSDIDTTASRISIDQHGIKELFDWLQEMGALH